MTQTEPLYVDCDPHGRRKAAVVCGHLVDEDEYQVGFIENCSDPNDLQAWCSACEELFQKEGEMTDTFRAFTRMSIVCVDCYAEIKSFHAPTTH